MQRKVLSAQVLSARSYIARGGFILKFVAFIPAFAFCVMTHLQYQRWQTLISKLVVEATYLVSTAHW